MHLRLRRGRGEEGAEANCSRVSKEGGGTKDEEGGEADMVRAKAAFSSAERVLGSKRTFMTSW